MFYIAQIDLFNSRQHMQRNWFEIFRYRDSYMNEVALHHHDFYEIYLFLNGNVTYSIESRSYVLQPGDLLLISPQELHRPIISPAKHPYERIVLWLNSSFIERFSTEESDLERCFDTQNKYHTNLLRPSEEHRVQITDNMNRLLYEYNNSTYGADLACLAELLTLLVTINRLSAFDKRQVHQTDKSSELVSNVLRHINENYSSDLSLDDISARFFVSKYYLSHEFNRLVGTSVYRYIVQKRLIIAKQLLGEGVAPSDACSGCGFGDYANFYRSFKSEYGISPKEFYKKQKTT